MPLRRAPLFLSCFALAVSCGSTGGDAGTPRSPRSKSPPRWCEAIEGALGRAAETGFRCLEVPNFLVTGFYGTASNPERSDFFNGCFAGEEKNAGRLQLSVRPVGDLRFRHSSEVRIAAGGGLDLGFLGPWAPKVTASAKNARTVKVDVELHDAEIRVLSSVAEILGQTYRTAEPGSETANALEACLYTLCDGSSERDPLVYTAKVIAAVPIIRLQTTSQTDRASTFSIARGTAAFEVKDEDESDGTLEFRAREKLNIAVLPEPARAAFERAGTCQALRDARARQDVISGLRELGLRTLSHPGDPALTDENAELRATLRQSPLAFTEHERRDLALCMEALGAAERELGKSKPGRSICETRDLVQRILTGGGADNRLHELLTDIAQPLHRRLTEAANDHALSCADPAFYRDHDGDGFGDPSAVVRAPKQPPGYVANSLDCFDRDANVRPGQRNYFAEPRADGRFDYDCDSREKQEKEVLAGGCKAITRFGIPIQCWAESGWRDRAPRCGEQGRWFSECVEGMLTCDVGPEAVQRQRCR